jgi:hypothetical protein
VKNESERMYLNNYLEAVIEKYKHCQFYSMGRVAANIDKAIKQNKCCHTQLMFKDVHQGIDHLHRANTFSTIDNGPSAQANAQQQSSYQVFRLLWQRSSGIIAVNKFNVNPFQICSTGPKNFINIMEEKMEMLWQHTEQPILQPSLSDSESPASCECADSFNRLVDQLSPPIFLKSNLRKMMRRRDKKTLQKLLVSKNQEEG